MGQRNASRPGGEAGMTYFAGTKSRSSRGLLVLHAWWGLNEFIRGFCDRLAAEGYLALAPDLYHGETASTIAEAKKLRSKLRQDTVTKEITRAARDLQELTGGGHQVIGTVGFSLGGYWALWLADQAVVPIGATVVFYGSRPGDYTRTPAAFQIHLAEKDDYVPASGVKKLAKTLKAAGKQAEFHTYPGTTHWFFESDRGEAFNPQAAEVAWTRMRSFLQGHL